MIKIILSILFIFGLIYVLVPEPGSISDYPPMPNSLKSDEPGDTYQVRNIAAYFSDFDRVFITDFYRNSYRGAFLFGVLFPPVTINHPPQYALSSIRDQLFSVTFVEEFVYPLRGSVIVAGYEPAVDNDRLKASSDYYSDRIHINGVYYVSKTTLRAFPTSWYVRLLVYLGIWVVLFGISKILRKVFVKTII